MSEENSNYLVRYGNRRCTGLPAFLVITAMIACMAVGFVEIVVWVFGGS